MIAKPPRYACILRRESLGKRIGLIGSRSIRPRPLNVTDGFDFFQDSTRRFSRLYVLELVLRRIRMEFFQVVVFQGLQHLAFGMIFIFKSILLKISTMLFRVQHPIARLYLNFIQHILVNIVNIIIFKYYSMKIDLILSNLFILMHPMEVFQLRLVFRVGFLFLTK